MKPPITLSVFREAGFAAEGTEVSDRLVRYASESLGIPVRRVTLEELEQEDERFDIITLYSVLEHLPQPRTFLRSALRLLRPGGLLVIRIPIREALLVHLFGARHVVYREAPRHIWIPSMCGLEYGVQCEGPRMISRLPTSVIASAGSFSLSIYSGGSSAFTDTRSLGCYLSRRVCGAGLAIAGIPFALCEFLTRVTSETDFFFRK